MSRGKYVILVFVAAVILTVIGWQQVMIYKAPVVARMCLWFPFIVLLGARDVGAVLVSLLQFPAFATAFSFGVRRSPVVRVFAALLGIYALCIGIAFIVVR